MCDRWKKRIKLNNHGSTLALAVATIAFVALLAATVISAASVNLALKRAQVYSDRAFYTAETAVDEVYTGLGVKSLNMLNSVFADVSSNLLETDLTTGMQFMVDNKTANLSMRQSFIQNMYKDLTGHKWSETNGESLVLHPTEKTSAIASAMTYLGDCIQNVSAANTAQKTKQISIQSIEDIQGKIDTPNKKYYILLSDVTISYLQDNDYFAEITTDIQIEYPNMEINFTEDNKLTDYLYYTLISDIDIAFDKTDSSDDTKKTFIASSIYAGNNINLQNKANVEFDGTNNASYATGDKVPANEISASHINLVARNDFNMNTSSKAMLKTTDLWAVNTLLGGTEGASFTTDAGNSLYLEDDLEINSNSSSADIKGNYYGYKSDGESINNAAQSSAIILNGKNSTLNMDVTDFILGGRSYIKMSSSVAYATGEGVSAKGDQDAYIVLDKYLQMSDSIKEGLKNLASPVDPDKMTITNPMSTDSWNQLKKAAGYSETGSDETILADDLQLAKELTASLTADDSNFFAKGMLNAENPVVVKKVAHNAGYEVFLYYNFSSKAKLADYVAELLNSSSAYTANEDYITEKMLLTNNLGKIVNGISITKNGSGKVYSNATLITGASGNTVNGFETASPTASLDVFKNIQTDLNIRRYLIGSYLVTVPKTTQLNNYATVESELKRLKNGVSIAVSQEDVNRGPSASKAMTGYILANDGLAPASYPDPQLYVTVGGKRYNLIVTDKNCEINSDKIKVGTTEITKSDPSQPTYGIIISYGTSSEVKVNSDFTGLIISQGNIYVNGSVKVYTNQSEVLEVLENNDCDFEKYFDAFNSSVITSGTDEVKISDLSYADMVSIVNWRK